MTSVGKSTNDEVFGDLLLERRGAIAVLTLNRPEKLNTITRRFYADLRACFASLEADGAIRAVVITGAGDKAFSAGGDIESFLQLDGIADRRAYQSEAMQTFMAVENSPLPTIAAVNGWALGGGCELTLACDIVLASEEARFGMPEAGLGLAPGYGIVRAPDVIGRQLTKMMVMARLKIDARRALEIGLVQQVTPAAELMTTALELAQEIARSSPMALDVGKRVINRGAKIADFDYAVEALAVLQSSPDSAEGACAFLEKRPPVFQDRLPLFRNQD